MVDTRRRVQGFQVSICLFSCFPSGHFKLVLLFGIQFVCFLSDNIHSISYENLSVRVCDLNNGSLGLISLRPSDQGPVCMFVCLFSFLLWPHSFAQSVVGRTLQYEATGPSWSKINSHCNVDDDDDDDEEEEEYNVWNVILTDNSN